MQLHILNSLLLILNELILFVNWIQAHTHNSKTNEQLEKERFNERTIRMNSATQEKKNQTANSKENEEKNNVFFFQTANGSENHQSLIERTFFSNTI